MKTFELIYRDGPKDFKIVFWYSADSSTPRFSKYWDHHKHSINSHEWQFAEDADRRGQDALDAVKNHLEYITKGTVTIGEGH